MENLKIKFYQEMEATTWANRFTLDMTLGELLKNIKEEKYQIEKHAVSSFEFGYITGSVLIIEEMKVQGVVLENGTKVHLIIKESSITHQIDEKEDVRWVMMLYLACKNNELKQEIENIKNQKNKEYTLNLNNYILVKLTIAGLEYLKVYAKKTFSSNTIEPESTERTIEDFLIKHKQDDEGYSKFQAWEFMSIFNEYFNDNQQHNMFDINIKVLNNY